MSEDHELQLLLELLKASTQTAAPGQGWIRAVRRQQNLLSKEFARKMQVSPARISVLERDEQRGAVTLRMMQKAAQALGCNFVYALVPRSGPKQAKPKLRLDSSYMQSDRQSQALDLQRQYARSLSKTEQQ